MTSVLGQKVRGRAVSVGGSLLTAQISNESETTVSAGTGINIPHDTTEWDDANFVDLSLPGFRIPVDMAGKYRVDCVTWVGDPSGTATSGILWVIVYRETPSSTPFQVSQQSVGWTEFNEVCAVGGLQIAFQPGWDGLLDEDDTIVISIDNQLDVDVDLLNEGSFVRSKTSATIKYLGPAPGEG